MTVARHLFGLHFLESHHGGAKGVEAPLVFFSDIS